MDRESSRALSAAGSVRYVAQLAGYLINGEAHNRVVSAIGPIHKLSTDTGQVVTMELKSKIEHQ